MTCITMVINEIFCNHFKPGDSGTMFKYVLKMGIAQTNAQTQIGQAQTWLQSVHRVLLRHA